MKRERQTIIKEQIKIKKRIKKTHDKRYNRPSINDLLIMRLLLIDFKKIIYS